MIEYTETTFSNCLIRQRTSNGYLNATDMCKANKKLYGDWYRLDSTKEYLKELSSDTGYHISQLVEVRKGNSKKYQQGTWIHPYVATNLAQWLSPKFAVFVSKLVFRYMTGDISLIDEIKQNNEALQSQLNALKEENKEKDDQLNRLHNIQKELLSYKKHVSKDEIVYIVSTANYAKQGIYKIGRTKGEMKFRSSSHNTTHIGGDKVKVLREFKINDCIQVEKNIHTKLKGLLLKGEREFFMCPYDLLESVVDLIVNNDDEQNELVNKIIDTVYKLKNTKFNSVDWMQGVPENVFDELTPTTSTPAITITIADEKVAELDISLWDDNHKKEFIASCLDRYVQQQNKIDEEYTLIWKTFQLFLFSSLSIPKSKFKVSDWKAIVKDEVDKKEKLSIKWRS